MSEPVEVIRQVLQVVTKDLDIALECIDVGGEQTREFRHELKHLRAAKRLVSKLAWSMRQPEHGFTASPIIARLLAAAKARQE